MIFYIGRLLLRPVLLHQTSSQGEIRLFCQVDELEHHKTGFVYLPHHHHHGTTVCLAGDGGNHPVPPLTLGRTRYTALPGPEPYHHYSCGNGSRKGWHRHVYLLWSGTSHHTPSLFLFVDEILPGLAGSLPTHVEQKSSALTFARGKAYNFFTIFVWCSHT